MSGIRKGKPITFAFASGVFAAMLLVACGERTQPEPTSPPPLVSQEPTEVFVDSQTAAEVKLKDNLLLRKGITLTASSRNQPTESVSSLIDGRDGSIWHVDIAAIGSLAWVMVDFGEGEGPIVRRLAAQPRADIPSQFFRFAELFGSHDGVNWHKVASIVQEEEPRTNAWQELTFDNSTAYRFYRLNILDGHGGEFGNVFLSMAGLGLFE